MASSAFAVPPDVRLALLYGVDAAAGTGMYQSMGPDAFAQYVNQYATGQVQDTQPTPQWQNLMNSEMAVPPDVRLAELYGVPAAAGTGMYQSMGQDAFSQLVDQYASGQVQLPAPLPTTPTPPASTPGTPGGTQGGQSGPITTAPPSVFSCPPGTLQFAGTCWNGAGAGIGSPLTAVPPATGQNPPDASTPLINYPMPAAQGASGAASGGNVNPQLLQQLQGMSPSSLIQLLMQLLGSGMQGGAPKGATG